jgi:hypothetical protein
MTTGFVLQGNDPKPEGGRLQKRSGSELGLGHARIAEGGDFLGLGFGVLVRGLASEIPEKDNGVSCCRHFKGWTLADLEASCRGNGMARVALEAASSHSVLASINCVRWA